MIKKRFWIVFLLAILFLNIQAQELLHGLNINPSLIHQNHFKAESAEATFLPFFDNFKQAENSPKANLWADQYAFVNSGFQKYPTDLGVATLDALDENGAVYARANSFSFIADYLTSVDIRLDSLNQEHRAILVSDSLYLSFYYQPQGSANAPEASDSLVLELYSGRDQLWYRVWSDEGSSLDDFYAKHQTYCRQILIPIKDSAKFYHADFKFRFYNYASLASSIQTSWQSNADQWNIDYVKLDVGRHRNDFYTQDLVFVNPPPSFLKNYRAMPYNQYKNDPTNSMADSLHSLYISNLDALAYGAEYQYHISNQTLQDSIYLGGAANINPFHLAGYSEFPRFKDPKVISFFTLYAVEEMEYTITHSVKSINLKSNTLIGDTISQKQLFSNYFAYDDGSSEAGYGLSGSGNSAALRFKLNTQDTLTDVQFYFNPTQISNEDYFYLTVWESIEPEVILYEKLVQAKESESADGFVNYTVDDLVIVSNEFYVGFTQTADNNINIGFDLSYAPKESLFYDAGLGWTSSVFEGALMLRPVFANSNLEINPAQIEVKEEPQIYPNPLKSGSLNIIVENGPDYLIKVYSLLGKLVYSTHYQEQISLDFLKEGVYILRFENQMNGEVKSQKLIINK